MDGVVVLDNGGGFVRAGFAGDVEPRVVVANCLARAKGQTLIGISQPSAVTAAISQRRPIDRGYLVNAALQAEIWSFALDKKHLAVDPTGRTLAVTQPPLALPASVAHACEVAVEKLGFKAFIPLPTAQMAAIGHMHAFPDMPGVTAAGWCGVVVDTGFSFTHAVPVYRSQPIYSAARRLNIGGKLMTNFLKETISYRAWDMMGETVLINYIKEQLCYTPIDFIEELALAKAPGNNILREFVLPDNRKSETGFVRKPKPADSAKSGEHGGAEEGDVFEEPEQVLKMNNERFVVGELLFRPHLAGVTQRGLSETIAEAIAACPSHLRAAMYNNIVLVGGTARLPGLQERIDADMRGLAPDHLNVNVHCPPDCASLVFRGAALAVTDPEVVKQFAVTRKMWREHGDSLFERFRTGS